MTTYISPSYARGNIFSGALVEIDFMPTERYINTAHVMVNPDYLTGPRQHFAAG
jgi:hypothetical protein